jgi:hypothetical protein
MKDWGRGVCLGTCAVTALLAMPFTASAKPGFYVSPASRSAALRTHGSNGYGIDMLTTGSRLVLFASKASGSASYLVRMRPSKPGEIKASLGKLGRISLRFRPSGPAEAQPEPGSECVGSAPMSQQGRFIGNLRFRGEDGFTAVHAASVKGEMFSRSRQVCKRPHEPRGGGREPSAVSLSAYVEGDPEKPSFSAYELTGKRGFGGGSPGTSYSASVTERRGQMTISRSASAGAEASTFAVSAPSVRPAVASVAPPFPFSGTAVFEGADGHAPTWSGDLSVSLPGLGAVPLTGSPFTARLCRDLSCACPPGAACVIFFSTSGRVGSPLRLLRDPARPPHRQGMWGSAP